MKLRFFLLFCLTAFLPSAVWSQMAPVVRGYCTPDLNEVAQTAPPRMGRLLRLPSVSTKWDSTRVYRQAVILVSYSDTDFSIDNPRETYDSMFNSPGFNKRQGPGCVAEYFREQSGGLFNMEFDVYGPIKVKSKAQPYSKPTSSTRNYGRDALIEATNKVIDSLQVDFTPYDWNGNGYVNQVIYVVAGLSGNQSAEKCYGYLWPNTSTFSTITTNGKKISNYTASCELWSNGSSCGIGTILHEFTHSLGLPDIYPTTSNAGYSVVDEWDLMDGGNFTNYGWCPPNYTPMEKMLLGWLNPVELTEPQAIRNLKQVADGGEVYRIKHSDSEWLMLENRQQQGWDLGLPGKGLLIYHVYYDKSAWSGNTVNNDQNKRRFELIHADNMDYDKWEEYVKAWAKPKQYANTGRLNSYLLSTSPYPWTTDSTDVVNDSLTDKSVPPAKMTYPNLEGKTMLSKSITNIVQNHDGTISFDFMGGHPEVEGDVNGDGEVNVADIAAIITVMAGEGKTEERAAAADVNHDGAVNVADISTVITIMAGT